MAAGVASRTGSRRDSLRRDAVQARVRQGIRLVGRTGSGGSTVTKTVCGLACTRRTPGVLEAGSRCLTFCPKGMAARPQLAGGEVARR
jgi:uncharacterized ferredoxin-like protein